MKKLILVAVFFAAHVFADDAKTFAADVSRVESISSKKEIDSILADSQIAIEREIDASYAEMVRNIEADILENIEKSTLSLNLEFKD
jgi:hypothetical protein